MKNMKSWSLWDALNKEKEQEQSSDIGKITNSNLTEQLIRLET